MDTHKSAKDKIIVALDVPTEEEALRLVSDLKDSVGWFKVGLELVTSVGPGIILKMKELGIRIFYDGKFKDIPNTVAGASRAVTRLGVKMFNVHAMGGLEMMKSALNASREEAALIGLDSPWVLGVTILTSIDQQILNAELHIPGQVTEQVAHLSNLIDKAGLDGIIASPQEIRLIRSVVSDRMKIITPGVRPAWAASQDQKRVMTPAEAVAEGAFAVVIGRPITKPPIAVGSPSEAANRIVEEINGALDKLRGK